MERDCNGIDIFFVLIWEFYGHRFWECSLKGLDTNQYKKPKFFLGKLLLPTTVGHPLKCYMENLIRSLLEIDGIQEFYLKKSMLNERGKFCKPKEYLAYPEPDMSFEPAKSIGKPFSRKLPVEYDYSKALGNPVFQFHRFKCFRMPIAINYTLQTIEAFCIRGNENEIMYVHLYLNSNSEITKLNFLRKKPADESQTWDLETSCYVIAHVRKAFIEQRYVYANEYKVT